MDDYNLTIRQDPSDGVWIVHCELCKHRRRADTHSEAVAFADAEPLRAPHQRWVGILALGGSLPESRGYDHSASYQYRSSDGRPRGLERKLARRREGAAQNPGTWTSSYRVLEKKRLMQQLDELSARRDRQALRPPTVQVVPTGQWAEFTLTDGRHLRGERHDVTVNGHALDHVHVLPGGEFVRRGWVYRDLADWAAAMA